MSEVTQLVPELDSCVFTPSSPRIVSETHHTDSMPPDEWHVMPRADHSANEFNQGIKKCHPPGSTTNKYRERISILFSKQRPNRTITIRKNTGLSTAEGTMALLPMVQHNLILPTEHLIQDTPTYPGSGTSEYSPDLKLSL